VKALVTGGAGFIGSNLVDALLARGDDVAVVDNLSTGRRANLDGALAAGARLHEADITDAARVRELIAAEAPEAIFHLAAQIDVRKSVEDPAFDAGVNVVGTINLLEAARAAGVPRFVNTSTGGAIYGDAPSLPADEDTPARPLAGYGQSKYAAEGFCGLYHRLYGMATVSLRYGNVFGPRQDPKGEAGVIAIFCGKLLDGGVPTIFGDGSQTRDYVYVSDVVAANVAAAERPEATGSFNIGRGAEVSVLELVESLKALGGVDALGFEPVHEPERLGEVQRSVLDTTRARTELGWEAQVGLAEGLQRTLESARDH
jgi:UDP-glucose 4-epimerase